MTETVPTGYLECDGSSKLTSSYVALEAIIGDLYGAADGTHFNLPDLRGYFLRGWNHTSGVENATDVAARTDSGDGSTTGDHVGTKQVENFKTHTGHSTTSTGQLSAGTGGVAAAYTNTSKGGLETRPINVSVMYCIEF